jgi:hypothetical protein
MDRDDFIITVYCLVCEHYQVIRDMYSVRRGGFAPALTDEEVITMEICGEYFKCATDQDIFDYFRAHYRTWFPALTDRTLFARQAANLWQVKAALQQRLTVVSGQADDPVQVSATLPLPICSLIRAPRDRCFNLSAHPQMRGNGWVAVDGALCDCPESGARCVALSASPDSQDSSPYRSSLP